MSEPNQDGEDYSYDLAHDAPIAGEPDRDAAEPEQQSSPTWDDREDPGGDYGYDEVHNLR